MAFRDRIEKSISKEDEFDVSRAVLPVRPAA
jgi:hypothetical protein